MSAAPTTPVRFAVYLVPAADDPYYQLGSATLGYDVRARTPVDRLPEVREEWVSKAGQYGFHLTVVEAFECDPRSFPDIEREIEACLACISPRSRFDLSGGRVETWDDGEVIVHRFDPSPALLVLHTLLLARLARFVTGSSFARLMEKGEKYTRPHERARIELLHTPRGLDTWEPHFTLLDPYDGPNADVLVEELAARFEPYPRLTFDMLTLLRQDGSGPYEVVRDFRVRDPEVNVHSQPIP